MKREMRRSHRLVNLALESIKGTAVNSDTSMQLHQSNLPTTQCIQFDDQAGGVDVESDDFSSVLATSNKDFIDEATTAQSTSNTSLGNDISCPEVSPSQSDGGYDLKGSAVNSDTSMQLHQSNLPTTQCIQFDDQAGGVDVESDEFSSVLTTSNKDFIDEATTAQSTSNTSLGNDISCPEVSPSQSDGGYDLKGSAVNSDTSMQLHRSNLLHAESPAAQDTWYEVLYDVGTTAQPILIDRLQPTTQSILFHDQAGGVDVESDEFSSVLATSNKDFIDEATTYQSTSNISLGNDISCAEVSPSQSDRGYDLNISPASVKSVPTPNSKNIRRTWDRKNFCIYCRTLVTNFCRHLVRWHPTEKEVMELTSICDDNIKERKRKKQIITNELRCRGNFLYNSSKSKDSPFLPTRRLPKKSTPRDNNLNYVSCRFCLGIFSRKTFYRHSKKCLKRVSSDDLNNHLNPTEIVFGSTKTHGSWKKDGIVMLQSSEDEPHVVAFKRKIAPIINKDEYGIIALNDPLIVSIGSHFFMNHSDPKDRYNCTKKLRDAAKLLKLCREDEEVINFSDCFKPQKFNVVMNAVHKLCGVDCDSGNVNVVGMPARLSYVIQEGASILICEAISNNNLSSSSKECITKNVNDFITLLKHKWKYMISTNAEKSRKKKLSLKHRILPDDEDIKVLATSVKALELQHYYDLSQNITSQNYEMLSKSVIAHMIILNRRRSGEVARAELQYYLNRPPQEQLTDDVLNTLTDEERNTLPLLTVFMVPGKLVHSVPILLTEQMKKSVDLIISCRLPLKISQLNPFLFARTCTDMPFDGSKIIKEFRQHCKLKKPDHMTSTGLRHHMATKSQIYGGEKYTENVCQFLGHTSNIHKQNYRIPLQAIQRGQIGSRLLQMEGGTSSSVNKTPIVNTCNKPATIVTATVRTSTLADEGSMCTIDEKCDSATVSPNTSPSSDLDYFPENDCSESEEFVEINTKKIRTVTKRRKWQDEEKNVVLNELGHFIKERKTPGMRNCISVLRKNPCLAGRSWSQLNVFINNYIKGKTKLPIKFSHLLK